ncbi:hypothetical protein BDA96_03G432900 [Sorghum bicolor]|uniref:Uncharacterized protein n=2 Tax=Sorghum bicolor TaxID=4558 RepID=A0A921URL9_SORBI|nr:hypothetical protein BDA96_03G432900 [Sorghum bicolor]KXG33979.1 hypothetical protein SORBI_3003G401300 [Sorghum bicolor]
MRPPRAAVDLPTLLSRLRVCRSASHAFQCHAPPPHLGPPRRLPAAPALQPPLPLPRPRVRPRRRCARGRRSSRASQSPQLNFIRRSIDMESSPLSSSSLNELRVMSRCSF